MENLIVAGIAGLVGYFIRGFIDSFYRRRHDKYLAKIKTDEKIFKLLNGILTWEDIRFMREQDFYASFQDSELKPFLKFKEYCECDPSFIFIDKKLEKLRHKLYQQVKCFREAEVKHTFVEDRSSCFRKVYPELSRDNPKVQFVANKLNMAGDEICKMYDLLVKTAIQKLKITK